MKESKKKRKNVEHISEKGNEGDEIKKLWPFLKNNGEDDEKNKQKIHIWIKKILSWIELFCLKIRQQCNALDRKKHMFFFSNAPP